MGRRHRWTNQCVDTLRSFTLFSQLQKTEKQITDHITALSKVVKDEEHQDIFGHLYECLSILDSKSSSMLSSNSIIIAVFAIFMTGELGMREYVIVNIGMAAIVFSTLLLLSVVWVHWSTTEDLNDPVAHKAKLLKVRNSRTWRYRLAWYLAVLSLVMLAVFLSSRLISRLFLRHIGSGA
jgi:hypothetical protein